MQPESYEIFGNPSVTFRANRPDRPLEAGVRGEKRVGEKLGLHVYPHKMLKR